MRIRDGKKSDPVSGMEKSRIRDPGCLSATLNVIVPRRLFFAAQQRIAITLKVPKCEIFDFHDFYTIKSLRASDFGVKIKKI
jgi:hypothetical protein